MALTINHQTNDISATSGSVTIDGAAAGGGGGGAAKTGRSAGTAMGKLTWILAAAFIVTSISLTVIAAQKAANESVISGAPASAEGSVPAGSDLLPTLETAPADAAEEEAPRAD